MIPKKNKKDHSTTDSNEQTVFYFSRSVLPTELINEVMSYLSVGSLENLASTSRENGIMVRNWLCTSRAIWIIINKIKNSVAPEYTLNLQNAMSAKIARFLLRVTVILPIEERIAWIFRYVPRVKKVWTFSRYNNRGDRAIFIAILSDLAEFATERTLDIAVESVLKRTGVWALVSDDCLVDEPRMDMKIRRWITEICPKQRLLLSAVKLMLGELSGMHIIRLIYVILGPCDYGKILWMPYVKSRRDLIPLVQFLNLLSHHMNEIPNLIWGIVNFPDKWPVKCTAYVFSKLDEDLCFRLPFSLVFNKSGHERLAEILVSLSTRNFNTAFTIFGNLLEENAFLHGKLLALKVFWCVTQLMDASKLMSEAESKLSSRKLRKVVFFGNKVSLRCVGFFKRHGEDVEDLPMFVHVKRNT